MNFDNFKLIRENDIVQKALNIFVRRKLVSEGYFYAEGCIEGWKLENTRKFLDIRNFDNNNINAKNTINKLQEIIE